MPKGCVILIATALSSAALAQLIIGDIAATLRIYALFAGNAL